jgi:tRNA-Thr(GGU) m(6)t(6)A37 methyltransferase TsaA
MTARRRRKADDAKSADAAGRPPGGGALSLTPVGVVRSELKDRDDAPMQGDEGAPDARIELLPDYADALQGITPGQKVVLITWLHRAERDVLQVHPRGDKNRPLTGVFATRSPARPNPIGLHTVEVLKIDGTHLEVGPLEAIDGTPVLDIKRVLEPPASKKDEQGGRGGPSGAKRRRRRRSKGSR